MLGAGLIFVVPPIADLARSIDRATVNGGAGGMAFFGTLIGAAPFFVLLLVRKYTRVPPFIRALRDPAQIVWLYQKQVSGAYAGSRAMIGLANGSVLEVMSAGQDLLDGAARLAPHATCGYTPQIEAAFRANPASLRRF